MAFGLTKSATGRMYPAAGENHEWLRAEQDDSVIGLCLHHPFTFQVQCLRMGCGQSLHAKRQGLTDAPLTAWLLLKRAIWGFGGETHVLVQ